MLNAHRGRAGVLALAAVAALAAVPAASTLAEGTDPPVGTVDGFDPALAIDDASPVFDVDEAEARAQGATVTRPRCIVGARTNADPRQLDPYLARPVRTRGQFVVTPSGNATLVCHADATPFLVQSPTEAVVVDNVTCTVPGGDRTRDSHVVLTPSGQLTLTCHI